MIENLIETAKSLPPAWRAVWLLGTIVIIVMGFTILIMVPCAFTVPLDRTSKVSITPYIGQIVRRHRFGVCALANGWLTVRPPTRRWHRWTTRGRISRWR